MRKSCLLRKMNASRAINFKAYLYRFNQHLCAGRETETTGIRTWQCLSCNKENRKNNPKAQEIEADNQKRWDWNRAVDMALISGLLEPKIMEVKRKEITEPIRKSITRRGNRPRLFSRVVTVAVEALEFLIASVLFKKPREVSKQTEQTEAEHPEHVAENSTAAVKTTKEEKTEPEQPKMTRLASKYPKLFKVNKELEDQNGAIQQKQKQLSVKKKELSEVTGWFKGRKKLAKSQ